MQKTILYCNCSQANLTPEPTRQAAMDTLAAAGVRYLFTDDLCGLCTDAGSDLVNNLADDSLLVLACFERTVRALLNRAGLSEVKTLETVNLRTAEPQAIAEILKLTDARSGGRITLPRSNTGWQPWYPLIDEARCTNCRQCLNFCLFGVYALGASKHVSVTRPTHCKTGCPACARVCPSAAIIFPKYTTAPINGDAVDEQAWKNTPPPDNLQQRLTGNVMQMLRNRTAGDRGRSLETLKDELDIPDSVIEGLKNQTNRSAKD